MDGDPRRQADEARKMRQQILRKMAQGGTDYGPLPRTNWDETPLNDEVEALPDDILAGLPAQQHTCPACGHIWSDDDSDAG